MLAKTPKPDPNQVFDVKNLVSWLKEQDPNTTYYYYDAKDCLLARYVRQRWGIDDGFTFVDNHLGESENCRMISVPDSIVEGTYGEVLARAEHFLQTGYPYKRVN